ncbi:hypothetical protein JCM15765_11620 [Paradesulfitobacterium aromaticivorans]
MKCSQCGYERRLAEFKIAGMEYAGGGRCCGPVLSVRECPECGKRLAVDVDRVLFEENQKTEVNFHFPGN